MELLTASAPAMLVRTLVLFAYNNYTDSSLLRSRKVICLAFILQIKNTAFHISKQRMLQPSSHHMTAIWMVNPEGTQDGNSACHCSHFLQCTLRRRLRMPDGSVVKNLPVMQEIQETWVQSLSREDPLEVENPMGRGASQPPPTP